MSRVQDSRFLQSTGNTELFNLGEKNAQVYESCMNKLYCKMEADLSYVVQYESCHV